MWERTPSNQRIKLKKENGFRFSSEAVLVSGELEIRRGLKNAGIACPQYPGRHSRDHAQPSLHRIKDMLTTVALIPQTTDRIVRDPTQTPGEESPHGLVKVTPSPP